MEESKKIVNKVDGMLDEIEASLRTLWPEDKPEPDRDDDEFWLYQNLTCAMVHISDLRCDLEGILDY